MAKAKRKKYARVPKGARGLAIPAGQCRTVDGAVRVCVSPTGEYKVTPDVPLNIQKRAGRLSSYVKIASKSGPMCRKVGITSSKEGNVLIKLSSAKKEACKHISKVESEAAVRERYSNAYRARWNKQERKYARQRNIFRALNIIE